MLGEELPYLGGGSRPSAEAKEPVQSCTAALAQLHAGPHTAGVIVRYTWKETLLEGKPLRPEVLEQPEHTNQDRDACWWCCLCSTNNKLVWQPQAIASPEKSR